MAAKLHYLTVQDMLWINLQVTGHVSAYSYANLEEATYYQYAYRDSDATGPQAARLLSGFSKKAPFTAGNDPTAFVAVLAFLELNGFSITLADADGASWYRSAIANLGAATSAVTQAAKAVDAHGHPTVRDTVRSLVDRFESTIQALGGKPVEMAVEAGSH